MKTIPELWAAYKAVRDKAEAEKRSLTAEELTECQGYLDEIDRLKKAEAMDQRAADLETELRQPTTEPIETGADIRVGEDRATKEPFRSFGEQLQAIARASTPGGYFDPRLTEHRAAGTGSVSDGFPSEGGFLVQTDIATDLLSRVYDNSQLLPRCADRTLTSGADSIKLNAIDETSRVDGSRWGGVRVYWASEIGQMTSSRPVFEQIELKLDKVTGLYFASDEMLEDAGILGSEVDEAFMGEFDFKLQDGLINGTGAGQFLGIYNSPSLVSVSKETGQAADTIVYENVNKMWARLWPGCAKNAVWLINQNCLPQLSSMALTIGTGGVPVYMPASGVSGSPYSTLFTRPVIPIEQCQTIGDKGDIYLADFSQYVLAKKGGIKKASSIHLKFDYNQTTFRWTLRMDGKPRWTSALTPYKGGSSHTTSPFITLNAR